MVLSVNIHFSYIKDNILVLKIRFPTIVLKEKMKREQTKSWLDLPSFCSVLILHHLSWAMVLSFPAFFFQALNITLKKFILWSFGTLLFSGISGLNLTRIIGQWHLFCHLLHILKIWLEHIWQSHTFVLYQNCIWA